MKEIFVLKLTNDFFIFLVLFYIIIISLDGIIKKNIIDLSLKYINFCLLFENIMKINIFGIKSKN